MESGAIPYADFFYFVIINFVPRLATNRAMLQISKFPPIYTIYNLQSTIYNTHTTEYIIYIYLGKKINTTLYRNVEKAK